MLDIRNSKILIVEDEVLTAEDLCRTLEDDGYIVNAVYTGEDAIATVGEDRPDLIIMDIVLRGAMDGIQAAEIIKSRYNIPIIYLTAYLDDNVVSRAKYSSPYSYLSKPYKTKDVLATVQAVLQKHDEHEDLGNVVSSAVTKNVESLQSEIVTMKVDVENVRKNMTSVKSIVDNCSVKINKFENDLQLIIVESIRAQFKEYFGDHNQHILDHGYIKDHRESTKGTVSSIKTAVITILVSVLVTFLVTGLIVSIGNVHLTRGPISTSISTTVK